MKKITASLLLICLSISIQGCIFKDLKRELETFENTYGISGQVVDDAQEEGPIIVALVSEVDDQRSIRQIVFTEPTGDFSFLVPAGDYRIAAFADANSNMTYDRGGSAGFFGAPEQIRVPSKTGANTSAERDFIGLTIRMTSSAEMLDTFPFLGFKGDCSLFMANNDGTVELESELDYRAQTDADEVVGLNEDHMSILQSKEFLKNYLRLMEDLPRVR